MQTKDELHLVLVRHTPAPTYTLGTLYHLGHGPVCFTVEDCDRLRHGADKRPGQTAIPAGSYELIINHSNKYKKTMPRVLDVPGFTGILIHPGNVPKDTEGCILPVTSLTVGGGGASRLAFYKVVNLLRQYDEAVLTVMRAYKPEDEDSLVPPDKLAISGWQNPHFWAAQGVQV